MRALAEEFVRGGGMIRCAAATGFGISDGRIRAATTAEGEIGGDAFVIACGAWSRPLAATPLLPRTPTMCAAGAMTGKLVAELVADRPPSIDPGPFDPARFG